jgi:hypothetical protein
MARSFRLAVIPNRLLLLFAICLPVTKAAEPICPWLNAATAGGFLQGPVQVAVTKNGEDVTCEFTRENGAGKLRIEVVTMGPSREELAAYKAKCEPPLASLRAIGNEAVACGVATKKEETVEQVVGRVRTQAFLVRLTVGSGVSHATLREKATKVAEQVAGILF